MDIRRDLFVTDERAPYFTLALASRDVQAHSLLSGLTADDHARIGAHLADAVTAIRGVLAEALARADSPRGTSSFGCGT